MSGDRITRIEAKTRAVLIVEDQPAIRSAIRETLDVLMPGLLVLEAADAAAANSLFAQARPSVVLMDVGLPDADGIELARTFKEISRAATVFVMSVRTDVRERALAAGAHAFISKDHLFQHLIPLLSREFPGFYTGPA